MFEHKPLLMVASLDEQVSVRIALHCYRLNRDRDKQVCYQQSTPKIVVPLGEDKDRAMLEADSHTATIPNLAPADELIGLFPFGD